jgi:hypothetical protein
MLRRLRAILRTSARVADAALAMTGLPHWDSRNGKSMEEKEDLRKAWLHVYGWGMNPLPYI